MYMAEATMEKIRPKDIRRLYDGGVIAGGVQRALNDLLADSSVRPVCVGSTVSDLMRQGSGTVAVMREGKQLLSFPLGSDAAEAVVYTENCQGNEDRYAGIAEKYGLSVIRS